MPLISVVGIEARNAAKKVSKGYEERAELRAAIESLTADKTLQLTPVAGEGMRKLKMMSKRAATEVNREIKHGESLDGNLLVWLATPSAPTGKPRGRPPGSGKKATSGDE